MQPYPDIAPGDRRRRVLLVDTDRRLLLGYANALKNDGYDVLEAVSFEDGKRLWNTIRPDILVVDVRLGQFNGLQLLMRARADRPDLQAIITCPFPDAVLEAETRRYGGTFLTKPLEPWQIVDAVRRLPVANNAVPDPVTPPVLIERRRLDRRQQQIAIFHQDRRHTERRAIPAEPPPPDPRTGDRRKLIIPNFEPERRMTNRRRPNA